MVVTVKGKYLHRLFADFIKSGKVMMNFKCCGNALHVQVLEEYTACVSIELLSNDSSDSRSISFYASGVLHVISKEEDVIIDITENVISFKQGTFNCTMVSEFEGRKELPDISSLEFIECNANRLKYLTSSAKSLVPITREMQVFQIDPVFSNNQFYVIYDCIAFVESMKFPECCISQETMSAVCYKLDEKSIYTYIPDKQLIVIKSSFYTFYVTTLNYNIMASDINGVSKLIRESKPHSSINLKRYLEQLKVVVKEFPKREMTLSFSKDKYRVNISSPNAYFSVGDDFEVGDFSMTITSAELGIILSIFKEEDSVEVRRGVNSICLQYKEKRLLITGLLY